MAIFVTCPPHLEPYLIQELEELGINKCQPAYRGVYVDEPSWENIYKINYGSRIASRVLLPVRQFRCFDRNMLYSETAKIDWTSLIRGRRTFAIDANVTHAKLRNSLFAAQVMKDAICDQIRQKTGSRPSIEIQNPDVQLNLFIVDNKAIISFDTSGTPLHRRGYRQEGGEAPLQENLAAALLKIANYRGNEILLDPCCGSSTILIEAALMASQTPPGYLRKDWGFMKHPQFNSIEWLKVKNALDEKRQTMAPKHLFGVDIGRNSVRIAKVNCRAAGFGKEIEIEQADFREYTPQILPNLILTNPPYGNRLDEVESLKSLYRSLGDFMKRQSNKPARGFVFTGNLELAKEIGLAAKQRHVLSNGGIDSRLLEFDLF